MRREYNQEEEENKYSKYCKEVYPWRDVEPGLDILKNTLVYGK